VAESYGGKFAVTLGLSALKAIEDKKLKLTLGGESLLLFNWHYFHMLDQIY
jgi:serine carboxypeptidase 1